MFSIQLETKSGAVAADPAQEIIWALQQISQALRAGKVGGQCLDSAGHLIGTWELVAERD